MLAEDLAQEGREAVIRRLRQVPGCPDSHLVVQARSAIYHYRRRGSSVDGKLDARSRLRHYQFLSLEQPIADDNGRLPDEIISDPQGLPRPTEEQALTHALFDCLRDNLSEAEIQALNLRLMDIPWKVVGEILGQEGAEISKIQERITTTVRVIWSRPATEQKENQKEKRAYTQTPPLPKELPANVLAVLADQERQAVEAYQQGASQEVAAQQSGLSQPTVSRLLAFVWESCQRPTESVAPRTARITRHDRREQLVALFHNRPAGELVTYEELLALFADVKDPQYALWQAISRCNRKLEGAEISLVKGQGYILTVVEDPDPMTKPSCFLVT
jgi:DNA-directed RNA polymerase specialized sigma subunit